MEIIKKTAGEDITIDFTKSDGSHRNLTGVVDASNMFSNLGYVFIFEKGEGIKQFDPKKLIGISVKGKNYKTG